MRSSRSSADMCEEDRIGKRLDRSMVCSSIFCIGVSSEYGNVGSFYSGRYQRVMVAYGRTEDIHTR